MNLNWKLISRQEIGEGAIALDLLGTAIEN